MADTLATRKRAFLDSQVRILSASFQAPDPSQWLRTQGQNSEAQADLPSEEVIKTLGHVNERLRKHNNAVFPPAALAHVAAQIDALYESTVTEALLQQCEAWSRKSSARLSAEGVLPPRTDPRIHDDGTMDQDVILTQDATIAALPKEWAGRRDDVQPSTSTLEAFAGEQDYASRLKSLRENQKARAVVQKRLFQLQQLSYLAAPLADPSLQVQPNLVGREGEVGKQMERMKALIEQVNGRVKNWS